MRWSLEFICRRLLLELIEAIRSRRSIRKFKPDAVPDEHIKDIIETARLAPSGSNLQPGRYVVIKSEAMREKLKGCTQLPFIAQAPVIIACCADSSCIGGSGQRLRELNEAGAFAGTPLENADPVVIKSRISGMDEVQRNAYLGLNVAIAIDHMTLRAVDLGLGTCWIMMFDRDKVKKLLELDEKYTVVALLPVGYPDQKPVMRPRISFNEVMLKEV